jgi:hypothetical protein
MLGNNLCLLEPRAYLASALSNILEYWSFLLFIVTLCQRCLKNFLLRLYARRTEAQLDDQMNAYRKLVSMKSDGSENDIESDIERSLKQLQLVNSQMQTWVSSGGSEVLSHTLTRHMEILQDLTQVIPLAFV